MQNGQTETKKYWLFSTFVLSQLMGKFAQQLFLLKFIQYNYNNFFSECKNTIYDVFTGLSFGERFFYKYYKNLQLLVFK